MSDTEILSSLAKSPRITTEALIDCCGEQTFTRGERYAQQDRVLNLMVGFVRGDLKIMGDIAGSDPEPYRANVTINADVDLDVNIDGHCTCPVGYNCKHVVALCLAFSDTLELSLDEPEPSGAQYPSPLERWLESLTNSTLQAAPNPKQSYPFYVLDRKSHLAELSVTIWMARPRKNGVGLIKGRPTSPEEVMRTAKYGQRQDFADGTDFEICQLLSGLSDPFYYGLGEPSTRLTGNAGALALELLGKSGRCFWAHKEGTAISWAEPRSFDFTWQEQDEGYALKVTPDALILTTTPPIFWDQEHHQIGPADLPTSTTQHTPYTEPQIQLLQAAPFVPKAHAEAFSEHLSGVPIPFTLKAPVTLDATDIQQAPTGHLTLSRISSGGEYAHCLWFEIFYGDHSVKFLKPQEIEIVSQSTGRFRIHRDLEAERTLNETVHQLGFTPYTSERDRRLCLISAADDLSQSATRWYDFLTHVIPQLEAEGWVIEQDDAFRMVFFEGQWSATSESLLESETTHDWFDVRFDLNLENNKTLPLAPLLAPLIGWDIDHLPEQVALPLGDDQYTHINTQRLKPYLEMLQELFQRQDAKDSTIKLSRFDLNTLDELGDNLRGADTLKTIAKKLKNFAGIETVTPPKGLKATLRPYQQQGLNWLQFLRQYDLNGILADDMGLGKTLQAIAHILTEKQENRLKVPALIVAPTSLMGNWRHEVAKFAPELNVTLLHGTARHTQYDTLASADIVLTTYALAHRDLEQLKAQSFHLLILDEAQAIKNAKAKMAQAVRQIPATHRLCLTGTPMENHLGELWSLFDFLMPGFLSTEKHFKTFYRTPIEKQGDQTRLASLQKRVSPFILRRNKSEVAKELPKKTEIQHLIAMEPAQSKLYESIRVTMDKQVRDAIANKGLAKSHIMVLDALLKLRQTCCDPQLLKMTQAKNVVHSAKMDALMALLDQLLNENRRVLIFSQFTSMLTIIENALKTKGISLTKLTGQTRNRDKAVEAFRSGKADVFLISLKAGGTGLNLVEADTVIIYDPWWNPAAENQAIDRAHRIGQDKPVFVYRLIIENSVEEKILTLQTHKKALADGIYDEEAAVAAKSLDAETIQSLFAPMSE